MRDLTDYTSSYLKANFEDYLVPYRNKHTLDRLNSYSHVKNILEIGCGMDPLFPLVDGYEKYFVVEPAKDFYENAVKKADNNAKVTCLNMPFSATQDVLSHHYDFIICSCLIHEVEDPRWFLKEIAKVCGNNTIVYVNTPNAYSVHRLMALEMGLIDDVHSLSSRNIQYQQHSVFDQESLNALAGECGFDVVANGSYFIKPFSHAQLFEMMEQNIIDEKVLDGLDGLSKYMPNLGCDIFVELKLKIS